MEISITVYLFHADFFRFVRTILADAALTLMGNKIKFFKIKLLAKDQQTFLNKKMFVFGQIKQFGTNV